MENKNALLEGLLIHADNALMLGQRLGEWCGHGPVLEQDIALTNISLDYIGRARFFYQYGSDILLHEKDEDQIAFLRHESEYKNCLLTEYPNTDFAYTVVRQFFVDNFYLLFFEKLEKSLDVKLAAIAEKCLKETKYHLKWSTDWILRLGDGTETSHSKIQKAIDDLASYSGEFFKPTAGEKQLADENIMPDVTTLEMDWKNRAIHVLNEATLLWPENNWCREGGKSGMHSEHMGYILSELQYMQRTYPGLTW